MTGATTIPNAAPGERRPEDRAALGGAAAEHGRATFALVPGQWTGAFVWRKVAPLPRAAGHEVDAVTCTGLGDRVRLASPAIDLVGFITDVANMLEYEDLHDVTLVGHSFAGMIVTGAAERVPERLARLVHFDACVPADGQNSYDADYVFPSEDARNEAIAADIASGVAADMPGFLPALSDVVAWLRGIIDDPAEAEWFIAKLTPHPLLTSLQPARLGNPAAAALPRAFILCTTDKDLDANPPTDPYVLTAQRARSDPNWRVVELANTHLANLNDPQRTADALLSLV
ncbi:MAG TPA: alpha/beta fold hydrolase [Thermomicrobiales bacterium]|nr:alpha/beta fold hydrolase [Thermomicrobiales bacterium]